MKLKRIIMGMAIMMAGVFSASASDSFSRDVSILPLSHKNLSAKTSRPM